MQDSAEPSPIKPVATEAMCDRVSMAQSERDSGQQCLIPANFVEVFHIPNPDSIYKETRNEEEAEDEADDDSGLLVEKCKEGEVADSQQEHQAAIKEPLPSAVTYEELRKAAARGDMAEASRLAFKMSEQASAERQAQARAAEEERLRSEDSSDEVHADDFADQIRITIGGRPAKTTSLTMKDLIRRDTEIEKVDYVSRKDGIINQFSTGSGLPWGLRVVYDSLILPARVEGFGTTRLLRRHISAFAQTCHASQQASLAACVLGNRYLVHRISSFPT
jgi:hypothetical protein